MPSCDNPEGGKLSPTHPTLEYDIADPANFSTGIPHHLFAPIRAAEGLMWNQDGPFGRGFWSVTRHADLIAVSRDPKTFSSEVGHIQIYDIDADVRDARASMIDLDPPVHTRLRRLVSLAFTPRHVQQRVPAIAAIVRRHVDAFVDKGGGDWALDVANPIPIAVICDLMGVPEADRHYMIELTDHLVEGTSAGDLDPQAYGNNRPLRELPFNSPAAFGLDAYARDTRQRCIDDPSNDLLSKLAIVEIDGERLSETEFARFFQLMIFAGNETTRSAMSHLAILVADHGDQFERIAAEPELVGGAAEEVVRYSSPILYFRRTATVDTEIAGTAIAPGDKVVMWYAGANFDEAAFEDPMQFDVARTAPGSNVGFGGGGVHFCLGAPLARIELSLLIEEIASRGLELHLAGDITFVESNFVNGVQRLPVEVRYSQENKNE